MKSKLLAFNRNTGALVFDLILPNTTNAPIKAIAGNSVIVPAGGPKAPGQSAVPEVLAYSVP